MLAEILGAIQTVREILQLAKGLTAFIQANRNEAWFQQSNQLMTKIREAKSEDEYKKIAQDLRNLWSGAG